MTDVSPPATTIPPDDGVRQLTLAAPNDPELRHIAMVGDTYPILLPRTSGLHLRLPLEWPG